MFEFFVQTPGEQIPGNSKLPETPGQKIHKEFEPEKQKIHEEFQPSSRLYMFFSQGTEIGDNLDQIPTAENIFLTEQSNL